VAIVVIAKDPFPVVAAVHDTTSTSHAPKTMGVNHASRMPVGSRPFLRFRVTHNFLWLLDKRIHLRYV